MVAVVSGVHPAAVTATPLSETKSFSSIVVGSIVSFRSTGSSVGDSVGVCVGVSVGVSVSVGSVPGEAEADAEAEDVESFSASSPEPQALSSSTAASPVAIPAVDLRTRCPMTAVLLGDEARPRIAPKIGTPKQMI